MGNLKWVWLVFLSVCSQGASALAGDIYYKGKTDQYIEVTRYTLPGRFEVGFKYCSHPEQAKQGQLECTQIGERKHYGEDDLVWARKRLKAQSGIIGVAECAVGIVAGAWAGGTLLVAATNAASSSVGGLGVGLVGGLLGSAIGGMSPVLFAEPINPFERWRIASLGNSDVIQDQRVNQPHPINIVKARLEKFLAYIDAKRPANGK